MTLGIDSFLIEAAALLVKLAHPNHIGYLCSWGPVWLLLRASFVECCAFVFRPALKWGKFRGVLR